MNLRISDGQLRFRITRDELSELLQGGALQLALPFLAGMQECRIVTGNLQHRLALREEKNVLTLTVDRAALEAFEKQLPSREGMEHTVMLAGGVPLILMLEVDVRKSKAK